MHVVVAVNVLLGLGVLLHLLHLLILPPGLDTSTTTVSLDDQNVNSCGRKESKQGSAF